MPMSALGCVTHKAGEFLHPLASTLIHSSAR